MINHFLNRIDDFDKTIIEMFHQNAKISLNEIASNLNLSQPAVAARKLRLERVGIIGSGTCPDFKKIKISLFRIKVISLNPLALKKKLKNVPILSIFLVYLVNIIMN